MTNTITIFTGRLEKDWLLSFCGATHRNYSPEGFKTSSIRKLDEFDAHWFMQAIDSDLVAESEGFFVAPRSAAKEQIFWDGAKNATPRPITLWVEPVITIGALARLTEEFGWPVDNLGTQSKTWEFDLVCYETNSDNEVIACEVKKDEKEIVKLLHFINVYCVQNPLDSEPENAAERNAYRKVQGIRKTWPKFFWALGPGGNGQAFLIIRDNGSEIFRLDRVSEEFLKYENA